jgi:hypothetical protein
VRAGQLACGVWLVAAVVQVLTADPALADNCGAFTDCFGQTGSAAEATFGLAFLSGLSLVLDFVPVVGDVKGIAEAVTGRDLLTGQELEPWERALGLIPLLPMSDAARAAGKVDDLVDVVGGAGRHGDEVVDAGRQGDELVGAGRGGDDVPAEAGAGGAPPPPPRDGGGGGGRPPDEGGGGRPPDDGGGGGFRDSGSGQNMVRRTEIDGVPISIKSGHGYRPDHGSVDITSVVGRDTVDNAVAQDLARRVGAGDAVVPAGSGHTTFRVEVGGHTVEYRAVHIPMAGRYEISTYYIP